MLLNIDKQKFKHKMFVFILREKRRKTKQKYTYLTTITTTTKCSSLLDMLETHIFRNVLFQCSDFLFVTIQQKTNFKTQLNNDLFIKQMHLI